MNKRKVRKIVLTFSDGTSDEFECDATMSESLNARKKYGFSNAQEWVEYHITWIVYVQDLPEIVPKKTIEEIEAESLARVEEKKKNPLYAGTQDGRDFYIGGVSHAQWNGKGETELPEKTLKPSLFPEFDLKDLMEGYGNGQLRSE